MGHDRRQDATATPTAPQTADVLVHARAILDAVAAHTPDAIFVKDLEGRYVLANAAAGHMLGLRSDEVLGRLDTELFTPADARLLRDEDAAVIASGETRTSEEPLTVRGEPVIFRTTKGPVRDATGRVVGLFGLSRVITEQSRLQDRMRTSEGKYRSVFDQSPIGKSITTLDGDVDCNDALCAMLGYTREELKHVTFQSLTHPDDMAMSEQQMRAFVSGEADSVRYVKRFVRKDGVVLWADLIITARRDASGAVIDFLSSVMDITERRQAEAALLESEDKFRYMFDHGAMGMSITRPSGEVQLNQAARELFGRTAEQLRHARWQDLTHPDDVALTQRHIDDLLSGAERVARFSKRFLKPDGSVVWADLISVLRRDADGAPMYLMTSMVDISERVRAEVALRESEHLFRESQRVANIGSYRAEFVAGFWRSSEVLDEIFGISERRDHPISEWMALIHPDDAERMAGYLGQVVSGAVRSFDATYRIVRMTDGAVRWVHGLGSFTFAADGTVVSMTGTIQDITARWQAEDALRKSEERHRAILRGALDGFWVVDREGNILEVNETYCRMSGYTEDELLSMKFDALVGDESPAEIAARTTQITARGEARFESRHRRKDGSTYPVAISVQHRPVDGGLDVAFIQDITARRQAETERAAMQAQLQQAQKMESVGRLAGGVAHDFNNMLGVILGHADLVLQALSPGDPLRDDIEEMRRAAARSVELTRQLLAFARKQTVAPQVLNLNETVSGMLKMLKRLIGEDIALTWRPHDALWPVKVDPSQVDQILANLCVNSRDAITGVGALSITTGHRTFSVEELAARAETAPGDYVLLSISDDGSGMDDETISHLFEPFYTTKALGKGTGLGLATVWGIVRQNQGFIDVTSAPGQGTTFNIYLPRHVGRVVGAVDTSPATQVPRGQETILIAEDEPGLLSLAARMLEMHGYRVLRAGTPGAAIALATEHLGAIDLLVTDVVMPEMNGRDLAKRLMSLHPGMRRLFMSGYTADVIAHRGVLDDGVHFLQKPFTQDTLSRKVREALDFGRVSADAGP